MNQAYQEIIAASDDVRRDLFLEAATHVGTTAQNIEKDFWVCWTLDALFHRLPQGTPRLLFKGGTSLSKGYGLISRFSEDIDVTVFRSDLGHSNSLEELEGLSRRRRGNHLDEIKASCQRYIDGELRVALDAFAKSAMADAGKDASTLRVSLDEADVDRQTLLVRYPSVIADGDYLSPSVKIESGAKSALDPNEPKVIEPYLTGVALNRAGLAVPQVTTIIPDRTFLDKILILHGMTFFFEANRRLRGDGRMSRHYYDVHRLFPSLGERVCANDGLISDCVRHATTYFYRSNTGLEVAKRGAFRLTPTRDMVPLLRRDYEAMATMIFGDVPTFEAVIESVAQVEAMLNEH